jgi:hypothetical protein
MNINKELYDKQLVHDNPQCLSAAVCKQSNVVLDDSDGRGEEFNLSAVDGDSYSKSDVMPAKGKTVSYLVAFLLCTN